MHLLFLLALCHLTVCCHLCALGASTATNCVSGPLLCCLTIHAGLKMAGTEPVDLLYTLAKYGFRCYDCAVWRQYYVRRNVASTLLHIPCALLPATCPVFVRCPVLSTWSCTSVCPASVVQGTSITSPCSTLRLRITLHPSRDRSHKRTCCVSMR